jgi:hypothetical protein
LSIPDEATSEARRAHKIRSVLFYCYLYLEILGKLWLKRYLYHARYYFNLSIVNITLIYSNIPPALAQGVYITQLIKYLSVCGSYHDFLERGWMLKRKLLNQECPTV